MKNLDYERKLFEPIGEFLYFAKFKYGRALKNEHSLDFFAYFLHQGGKQRELCWPALWDE